MPTDLEHSAASSAECDGPRLHLTQRKQAAIIHESLYIDLILHLYCHALLQQNDNTPQAAFAPRQWLLLYRPLHVCLSIMIENHAHVYV